MKLELIAPVVRGDAVEFDEYIKHMKVFKLFFLMFY